MLPQVLSREFLPERSWPGSVIGKPRGVQPIGHQFLAHAASPKGLHAAGQGHAGGIHHEPCARDSGQPRGPLQKPAGPNQAASPQQRNQPHGQEITISGQQLVRPLTVKHDFDPHFTGQTKDPVLGIDACAAKRLVLHGDQAVQVGNHLTAGRLHLVHDGLRFPADQVNPLLLAERLVVGNVAEGVQFQAAALQLAHGHDNGRRVDAAGQGRPHRHVAPQVQPNAVDKQPAKLGGRLVKGQVRLPVQVELPEALRFLRLEVVQRDFHVVGRRQIMDSRKERGRPVVGVAVAEIVVQRLRVHAAGHTGQFQQGLDFGGEGQPALPAAPKERLDAEGVPGQQHAPPLSIQDGKGEHADQAVQSLGAPAGDCLEQHFGITMRPEGAALLLQLLSQLEVIVDLAVEDQVIPAVGGAHGLASGLAQVQDRKPPVNQQGPTSNGVDRPPTAVDALAGQLEPPEIIGPAVLQNVQQRRAERHCLVGGDRPENSRKPAHSILRTVLG